ncbi:putative Serine/Threonine-protein phosphatase [Giardia muris]|uniref:Serine/threonine-protein phosphatase n=1 Tax=Giardia muris TaxID=5742 RepID=A0A4Z1SWU2_GIAMU|nr:putative Serine/Threonine-protein phosphatase [Giardia muris]|eukprot:TNJ29315.1 putative Serine/Threonine-protein phosphatase [Giardia muris]
MLNTFELGYLITRIALAARTAALYTASAVPTVDLHPIVDFESVRDAIKAVSLVLRREPNVIELTLNRLEPGVATLSKRVWTEVIATKGGPRIYVIGDLHGNFHALLTVLSEIGLLALRGNEYTLHPELFTDIKLIFVGDYIDRGSFAIEIVVVLSLLKIQYPDFIVLLRGNHETISTSLGNTTFKELMFKYGREHAHILYQDLIFFFHTLPLACVINSTILCLHGGIPGGPTDTIKTIADMDRMRDPVATRLNTDALYEPLQNLLWADYSDDSDASDDIVFNTSRGTSITYNNQALENFLKGSGLSTLIRGHDNVSNGHEANKEHTHYTVFSCPLYDDENDGTLLKLYRPNLDDIPQNYRPLNRLMSRETFIAVGVYRFKTNFYHDSMKYQPLMLSRITGLIPIVGSTSDDPERPQTEGSVPYTAVLNLDDCFLRFPTPTGAAQNVRIQGWDGYDTVHIHDVSLLVRLLGELCTHFGLSNYSIFSAFPDFYQWLVTPTGAPFHFRRHELASGHFYLVMDAATVCVPLALSQPIFSISLLHALTERAENDFEGALHALSHTSEYMKTLASKHAVFRLEDVFPL